MEEEEWKEEEDEEEDEKEEEKGEEEVKEEEWKEEEEERKKKKKEEEEECAWLHCAALNLYEDRVRYVGQYQQKEGIALDPFLMQKNPGRKATAKLMLNSFWGKFGENLHKPTP